MFISVGLFAASPTRNSYDNLNENNPEIINFIETGDIQYLQSFIDSSDFDQSSIFADIEFSASFVETLVSWIGTRYRYGGRSKKGVDCSNFVSVAIENAAGFDFPASSKVQSKLFHPIKNLDDLQFGDLIFFSGTRSSSVGHVGFYLGNGNFVHSSSYKKRGVVVTHISESKYMRRFLHGGRFIKEDWNIAGK